MLKEQWKSFFQKSIKLKGRLLEIRVVCTALTDEENKTQQFSHYDKWPNKKAQKQSSIKKS